MMRLRTLVPIALLHRAECGAPLRFVPATCARYERKVHARLYLADIAIIFAIARAPRPRFRACLRGTHLSQTLRHRTHIYRAHYTIYSILCG